MEEGPLPTAQLPAPLPAVLQGAVAAQERPLSPLPSHPAAFVIGAIQKGVPPLACKQFLEVLALLVGDPRTAAALTCCHGLQDGERLEKGWMAVKLVAVKR